MKNPLKKLFCFVLVAMLTLALVGCGGDGTSGMYYDPDMVIYSDNAPTTPDTPPVVENLPEAAPAETGSSDTGHETVLPPTSPSDGRSSSGYILTWDDVLHAKETDPGFAQLFETFVSWSHSREIADMHAAVRQGHVFLSGISMDYNAEDFLTLFSDSHQLLTERYPVLSDLLSEYSMAIVDRAGFSDHLATQVVVFSRSGDYITIERQPAEFFQFGVNVRWFSSVLSVGSNRRVGIIIAADGSQIVWMP